LAARSDRLTTSLVAGGIAPGDRVIVMLGNQVELWESMLAVMKFGAVIMPATSAQGPKDIADRVGRGAARHVITNADQVDKFADIPGDFGRIAIGDAPRHQPGGGVGPGSGSANAPTKAPNTISA
jgi:acetyl-CoA synthetase